MSSRRAIPSIERLLERAGLVAAAHRYGRDVVTVATRDAADVVRRALATGVADEPDSSESSFFGAPDAPDAPDAIASTIETRVINALAARTAMSLRRVINATGVVLHTNLGRAPLAEAAITHLGLIAGGYTNLEYDLDAGARGRRHVHAERLLCHLTGAASALVVNNNAAGTLLALTALAAGREVIVSRGELVEIGGGFRVPDVLAQSGATLREVGTTNRTRVADYAAAISDRTALLLRVHPSNFQITGFTERPNTAELAALAHEFHLPLVDDLGSGWLGLPPTPPGLEHEPSVVEGLRAGADVVAFSGDKLLGGPQAGLLVGRADLVETIGRHPLMRALRADKLVYAALEATLRLWAEPTSRADIPVVRMLNATVGDVDARARRLAHLLASVSGLSASIVDDVSTPGGGSAPGAPVPSRVVVLRLVRVVRPARLVRVDEVDGVSAHVFHERLRRGATPVVARIEDDAVRVDVRTVHDDEITTLAAMIAAAAGSASHRDA